METNALFFKIHVKITLDDTWNRLLSIVILFWKLFSLFQDFRNISVDWKYYNIFNFVCDDLLPKLRQLSSDSSVDLQKTINYLKTMRAA